MMFANPLHSAALAAYPVGSIYMSANATDPGTLFGGTWSRIQGRFLLAADENHAAGSTGGEATVTLSVNHLPGHTHDEQLEFAGFGVRPYMQSDGATETGSGKYMKVDDLGSSSVAPIKTRATGGGQAHNNMPPYLAVYCWQRTA